MNLQTAVGHGTTRKGTEKSAKFVVAVRHLPGDVTWPYSSLFVCVIPCISVAKLPFLG